MNSELEDKLLDSLAQAYLKKGLPLSRLLDNKLFDKVSLEKRVAILEKYSTKSKVPTTKFSDVGGLMGMGVVSGLSGVAGVMAAKGIPFTPTNLAVGAGLGGILGAVLPYVAIHQNNVRDTTSHNSIKNNQFIQAIAERSMSNPTPVPSIDLKSILDRVEKNAYPAIAEADLTKF